ncbi:hypothetical protein MBLNU459_g6599t1 [Dothideomycetes sp. NU459]
MAISLTSGSVYLSFSTLFATQEGFGERIGPNFTNFIVPLPSSAISTQCGGWFSARGAGTQLNYADLNYPIPASAYSCENRCSTQAQYSIANGTGSYHYNTPSQCNTIWSDFNPILAIPTEIRDLVPAWATCSFYDAVLPNFLFDPPLALQPANVVATPTLPGLPGTTTPASPGSTSYTALQETAQSMSTKVEPQPVETPTVATTSNTMTSSEAGSQPTASTPDPQSIDSDHTSGFIITIGSQTLTGLGIPGSADTAASANPAATATNLPPGVYVVDGSSITMNGAAQIINGHTLSLGANGFVVDGASTVPVSSWFTETASGSGGAPSPGVYVTDGHSITMNGAAQTLNGHTLSLGANGLVVDGTSTVPVPAGPVGTTSADGGAFAVVSSASQTTGSAPQTGSTAQASSSTKNTITRSGSTGGGGAATAPAATTSKSGVDRSTVHLSFGVGIAVAISLLLGSGLG